MTESLNSIPISDFIRTLPKAVQRQVDRQNAAAEYCGQVRNALKALRKQRGRSQKQIAEAMGVNQSVISRIERDGNTEIGLDTVFRYAQALGLQPVLQFEDTAGSRAAERPSHQDDNVLGLVAHYAEARDRS